MMNVLLVEDEYIVRRGMQVIVEWEKHGFHLVDAVGNGAEALEVLEREQVDIVITDVIMPVVDGIALCREIRERELDCEIVIVSSHDDFAYAKQAMQMGVSDYLHKPTLSPEGVVETLQKAAESLQRRRETDKQLRAYDESYEVIRKTAIRRLFSDGDGNLFQVLLEDERAQNDPVGTVLLLFRGAGSHYAPHLTQVARHIRELHQDDAMTVSCPLAGDMIALFYFGEGFEGFVQGLPQDPTMEQCAISSYPPVPLPRLPEVVEMYAAQARDSGFDRGQNPLVSQALAYLAENYEGHISLGDVADTVHVTASYLSRLLLRECGKNFTELLSELRIKRAMELLATTDLELERITGMTGYKNSKYFIKAFKRAAGMTPGQYRKQARSEKKDT